ncbi:uncharacterized protein [Pleurodeles waltl]|uniref:uncharacterized protein n=1 Tax=Pleurodeles waltl TaxID=8319 RepID=UPI003709853A
MVGIVPKKEAPGVDFCGVDKNFYIVRSDMNCYMRSTNFNQGQDLNVFSLHQSCKGGDHYLAHEDDLFYIIKGNNYRRVANMNTDSGAVVYSLHPNCQGGDHYLSAFGNFYIIFQGKGTYRRVKNMNSDEDAVEYQLHPNCKNGLYYWGTKGFYYYVKPHDEWGVQYYRCTNFNTNEDGEPFSFHSDVISFMPGGLAVTKGPAYGTWECIKTIANDSNSTIDWTKKITRKVGYASQKMKSVEKSWNVSMSYSYNAGDLMAAFVKQQFAFSTSVGGKRVDTESENWNEATEIEESVSIKVEAHQTVCVWQYKLGLGKEDVLFCRSMKFSNSTSPPTEIPLPPSK